MLRVILKDEEGRLTLEYETAGEGEPVLLIHGSQIADSFRPLLAETKLTDCYRLISFHRRGYMGSSPAQGHISLTRQAADCRLLLDSLGVQRVHVVGHSFGGAVALQLALDAPELVHSLALLEPALVVGGDLQGYRDELSRALERHREGDTAIMMDGMLKVRFGPDYRAMLDEVLPGAWEQALSAAETTFEHELPGLLAWSFTEADAKRITQPILTVIGSESEGLSPRIGEQYRLLQAWLPQAEPFVLQGAAHDLQIRKPAEMAEGLLAFFGRHPLRGIA